MSLCKSLTRATCDMQRATCDMRHATCDTRKKKQGVTLNIPDVYNMRRAACDMRHATCKHATINMRRATCDMQQATRSPSPFTCSHANMPTCNMRQGDASDNSISDRNMQGCLGELSGGGSEWAACTLRSGDGIIEELTQRQAVAGHG